METEIFRWNIGSWTRSIIVTEKEGESLCQMAQSSDLWPIYFSNASFLFYLAFEFQVNIRWTTRCFEKNDIVFHLFSPPIKYFAYTYDIHTRAFLRFSFFPLSSYSYLLSNILLKLGYSNSSGLNSSKHRFSCNLVVSWYSFVIAIHFLISNFQAAEESIVGLFNSSRSLKMYTLVRRQTTSRGESDLCPWHKLNSSHGAWYTEIALVEKSRLVLMRRFAIQRSLISSRMKEVFWLNCWPLCARFYCQRLHGTRHLRLKRSTTGTSTVCVWPG